MCERWTAAANHDFIVIDCPGADSYLSRLGHASADTLITPLNESFIDLDLLCQLDPMTLDIIGPSIYAEKFGRAKKPVFKLTDRILTGW